MYRKKINRLLVSLLSGYLLLFSGYAIAADGVSTTNDNNASIPLDEVNNFAKVYAITKNYYVESVADDKLIKGAINGMLTNLDPHSQYLDQNDFRQLSELTTGAFGGLGIEVSKDKTDAGIKVVAPIDGTPAYLAGIKSGDTIIKIDGKPIADITLDEAVKRMRGKPGTAVNLTILRKSELKPIELSVKRAVIRVTSVKTAMLTHNYGYVRITDFQQDTLSNLVRLLNQMYKKNPQLSGLVLDLRDNPGGLLQAAVGVSSVFLPKDSLVVYTNGRAPNSSDKFYNRPSDYDSGDGKDAVAKLASVFKTIPMVVLVNQGTASASEIVAGALQDYNRAKIVGTKTFGKGSVQTVIPLSKNTAVKLTTALYYTPKGRSIQALGIKPNIIVKSEYSDILDSWNMSEAQYGNHLANPTVKNGVSISKDKDNTPVIMPAHQIKTQKELDNALKARLNKSPAVVNQDTATVDLKADFQLQWGLNILQNKPLPKN